jgi:hypothetical protein
MAQPVSLCDWISRRLRFPALRRILLLLGALSLGWHLFFLLPDQWLNTNPNREAYDYFLAAKRVRTGDKLYRPWPEYGPYILEDLEHPYPLERFPYPPTLAVVLSPFTRAEFYLFVWRWNMILFGAFWVYAWCLAQMATGKAQGEDVLLFGLAITLIPWTTRSLYTGMIDPLLWAFFGLALVTPLAGIFFSLSALVKLYAGWPLVFSFRREGRRPLLQAIPVLALGLGIGCLAGGWRVYLDWARYFLPVVGQGTFNANNVSLTMLGLRLARLLGWHYTIGPLPAWARLYIASMELVGPLLAGWLTRKRMPAMQYACAGTAAALF